MLLVGVLLSGASCTDGGSDGAATSSTTTSNSSSSTTSSTIIDEASLSSEELIAARCDAHAIEEYVEFCDSFAEFAVEEAEGHGCDTTSAMAYTERYLLSEWSFGPPSDFFHRCPPALEDLIVGDPLPGFEELGPGQPEVGPQMLDDLASIFSTDVDGARAELEELGISASAFAHWVRGSIDDESLVIHLELFEDEAGASRWTERPPDDPGEPIEGIDDARLTTVIHDDRDDATDYRALPVQRLAFGRVCNVAVTVFHRARTEEPAASDLIDLFRRQAAIVAQSCDALEAPPEPESS